MRCSPRYSRSSKSLRRLFLDEFVDELDMTGDATVDATVGVRRAEELYDRVFLEYGDDSVAQLGGVHLACEQASNLLTKVLEWGRLMAYLEQSTRYVAYDTRAASGHYRYYRDPAILASPLGARYVGMMDRMFDTYGRLLPLMQSHLSDRHPKEPGDSDFVYRQSIKARALDALRGLLPAGSISNVGIYGTGQSYEALLLRMRAHPLPEAREYPRMMLEELRKVIPSFLQRVDRPERGGAWSGYMARNHESMGALAASILQGQRPGERPLVSLVDYDPRGEDKVLTAMLYPHSDLPEDQLADKVRALSDEERQALVRAYVGERTNRRQRPGRALERTSYRFDIVSDYGAFRDLQRHRMLTIEWQQLGTDLGYVVPEEVVEARLRDPYEGSLANSALLHSILAERFPVQSAYAVALAFRMRYVMHMTAREAMHVIELRSGPQGHPAYREIAREMHRLIAEEAGHYNIAAMMSFVDRSHPELGRLDSERRAEGRRLATS